MDTELLPVFKAGIMFYHATLDGAPIRAGITLDAFERLMARAGLDAERCFGEAMIDDMLAMLKPTIEAHLQSKHYREGEGVDPLIIDVEDLVTH